MSISNYNYWLGFIKQHGLIFFLKMLLRKLYFIVYKFSFKKCNSVFFMGNFFISGKKNISIIKLSAGNNFRMEAISFSANQKFTPEIVIGNNVSFGNDIHIGCISKLTIGNNVLCGSNIVIIDHDHGCYSKFDNIHSEPSVPPASRDLVSGSIVIGDNVHIGEYVVILKNIKIGSGSVIGAGSVVTRSVPDNCVAVGNPAQVIKHWDAKEKKWKLLNT